MTPDYRLILVNERDASVREFRFSFKLLVRVVLGATVAALSLVGLAVGLVLYLSLPRAVSKGSSHPILALREGLGGYAAARLGSVAFEPVKIQQPCGVGMILVEGEFCPSIHQQCLRAVDPEGSSLYGQRCAEYAAPVRCLSPQREKLRYCIDQDEFVGENQVLPHTSVTVALAQRECKAAGKRLCTDREWTFACEGEGIDPYPYGSVREPRRCNTDRANLVSAEGELLDHRAAPGSFAGCLSSFGVRDLAGNAEEFVVSDSDPSRVLRKGAYWQPGANTCRSSQEHPDVGYRGIELGFRCCSEAMPGRSAAVGAPAQAARAHAGGARRP